jgi:hypothetical protein
VFGFNKREKKTDLAIVNRSFWPQGQVIGEGLLQFSETVAKKNSVCVITQEEGVLSELLVREGRGKGVTVRACKSYSSSGSGLFKRVAEACFFMFWAFVSLVRARPANVYVSTDPPVVVPFIVALYCRLFKANYIYHLQDIHPEAVNVIVPLNSVFFAILQKIDNYTIRHAKAIVTLSKDMKESILNRTDTSSPIYLLDNPSYDLPSVPQVKRSMDVVFCGNAGRLQRIPLLIESIRQYIQGGGKLHFTFAGAGVHAQDISSVADEYQQVSYLGVITASKAAELVSKHRWALLPIDDEVTKYAFPSKSSGYALSGTGVLAVCGIETSVSRWVYEHGIGITCEPELDALVKCFFALEQKQLTDEFTISQTFREQLQISYFAQKLRDISLPINGAKV